MKLHEKTAPVQLRSLAIGPQAAITTGQTVRLKLSGVLSDGKSAPEAVLSAAVWSTGNPAVATVSTSGEITGIGPGTTRVTARDGSARASAVVTVTVTGPSPSSPGDGGDARASRSPTPSASAPPAPTPTPNPNPTPSLTPTPLTAQATGDRR